MDYFLEHSKSPKICKFACIIKKKKNEKQPLMYSPQNGSHIPHPVLAPPPFPQKPAQRQTWLPLSLAEYSPPYHTLCSHLHGDTINTMAYKVNSQGQFFAPYDILQEMLEVIKLSINFVIKYVLLTPLNTTYCHAQLYSTPNSPIIYE